LKHYAISDFWQRYSNLPADVQREADKAYALLRENPRHPSLRFKKIGQYWSVRVGSHYRALAVEVDDGLVWFWIGSHAEYDRLLP
jgi:hypothetical protein